MSRIPYLTSAESSRQSHDLFRCKTCLEVGSRRIWSMSDTALTVYLRWMIEFSTERPNKFLCIKFLALLLPRALRFLLLIKHCSLKFISTHHEWTFFTWNSLIFSLFRWWTTTRSSWYSTLYYNTLVDLVINDNPLTTYRIHKMTWFWYPEHATSGRTHPFLGPTIYVTALLQID